jgi:hypothetical protein
VIPVKGGREDQKQLWWKEETLEIQSVTGPNQIIRRCQQRESNAGMSGGQFEF